MREGKPDFAEEESVGLLKALRRGRRDYQSAVWRIELARYAENSDGRTERRRERRAAESSEQRETRLARRRVADRARYAANSDGRTERRRERRAVESSEQRETRLARRRVADSLLRLVASE